MEHVKIVPITKELKEKIREDITPSMRAEIEKKTKARLAPQIENEVLSR